MKKLYTSAEWRSDPKRIMRAVKELGSVEIERRDGKGTFRVSMPKLPVIEFCQCCDKPIRP